MRIILVHSLICYVLCVAGLANAEHITDSELYLNWHKKCISDNTAFIDEQIVKFEARLAHNPGDNLAKAYLGSACALRAKASFWGMTKLKYLKRGRKLLEQAVASAPTDPRVRMVRAIAYYKVPTRFDCRPTAITDFEKLLPTAIDVKSSLKINERQVILYYAYLTFSEEGHPDAGKVKKLCHRLMPGSKYGKMTAE
ncbi:MAG: hypothetical protein ACSHX0_06385 [Akkermansiaceae bacterium]